MVNPMDGEFTDNKEMPPEVPSETGENPNNMGVFNKEGQEFRNNNISISNGYYFVFGIESLVIISIIIYLFMSRLNKRSFKETFINLDKITIYVLLLIIITTPVTIGLKVYCDSLLKNDSNMFFEEETPKDEVQLNKNNIIDEGEINLSTYDSDVTITKSGTYTFKGNFNNSIIVDASNNDDVLIVLDSVSIENKNTATIIGLNGSSLTINVKGENTLTDGGNSSYDGCIYSDIPLLFEGDGILKVNGNQN